MEIKKVSKGLLIIWIFIALILFVNLAIETWGSEVVWIPAYNNYVRLYPAIAHPIFFLLLEVFAFAIPGFLLGVWLMSRETRKKEEAEWRRVYYQHPRFLAKTFMNGVKRSIYIE